MTLTFDGYTYAASLDEKRLSAQWVAVRDLMVDGRWRTLSMIGAAVGAPEASVSARLRDLRKPRFGSWVVDCRLVVDGLHEYRLSIPDEGGQALLFEEVG